MTSRASYLHLLSTPHISHSKHLRLGFIFPHYSPHNLKNHHKPVVRHPLSGRGATTQKRPPSLLRAAISDSPAVGMAASSSDEGSYLSIPESAEWLYFCYGSNMLRERLRNRGPPPTPQISFSQVWTARLPDWQLCFDLVGAPPQEPCMGSIRQQKGDEVYGLVYQIATEDCWKKLLVSEGITGLHDGKYDSYHIITVEVECYDTENPSNVRKVSARTLVTNPKFCLPDYLQPLVRPSQRYMNLLIEGATQEQLPPKYIQRLQEAPVARLWQPSLLSALMTLSIPFTFLARKGRIAILTYPLSRFGIVLYAMHERFATDPRKNSIPRSFGRWFCHACLLVLYSIYAVPSVFFAVFSPRGRHVFKILRMKRRQTTNKTPAATVSTNPA